jgi:D-sedoheptulose 7-phosphate isomerase
MSTYAFDIDGIICKTGGSNYTDSSPNHDVIVNINTLYEQGHVIKIFTGRGAVSGKDWKEFTRKQLDQWGVKYTELIMGKPHFNYLLDDKTITMNEFMINNVMVDCLIADMVKAFKNGNKVLVCGNGGLASDSEHFVAELVGKYGGEVYLPAMAITCNSALMTCIPNDFGFENVFSHQVEVLGKKGDVLFGMTTSRSANIIKALMSGKEKGLITVAVCSMKWEIPYSDYKFRIYGNDTAELQNEMIKFLHRIAFEVKRVYAN